MLQVSHRCREDLADVQGVDPSEDPSEGEGGEGVKKLRCAKWCGRGCTQEEYLEAKEAAMELCVRLGKGWKTDVWETLGWHYAARSTCGRFIVRSGIDGGWSAFLGEPGRHGGRWVSWSKSPQGAVASVLKTARQDIAPWLDLLIPEVKG